MHWTYSRNGNRLNLLFFDLYLSLLHMLEMKKIYMAGNNVDESDDSGPGQKPKTMSPETMR